MTGEPRGRVELLQGTLDHRDARAFLWPAELRRDLAYGGGTLRRTPAFTDAAIRFTTRGSTLYAIAMAWPPSGVVHIRTLANGREDAGVIAGVDRLDASAPAEWTRDEDGLHIQVGAPPPATPPAVAFRIRRRCPVPRSRSTDTRPLDPPVEKRCAPLR